MISLEADRLLIIRALSHAAEKTLICDKYLPFLAKQVIDNFSKPDFIDPESSDLKPDEKLANLYSAHGIALFRCLLDNFHLLYSKDRLEEKLEKLLDRFYEDIKNNTEYIHLVLKELNRFSGTPFDVLQVFIDLVLSRICVIDGWYEQILFNISCNFELKYRVYQNMLRCDRNHEIARNFLLQQINYNYLEFDEIILPLAKSYSKTGKNGFSLLLESYNKKEISRHAPFLLASFGDIFCEAMLNDELSEPTPELVNAIFQSLQHIRVRSNKDAMITKLIDHWCNHPKVAVETKQRLKRLLIKNEYVLTIFNDSTIKKIMDFVDLSEDKHQTILLIESIKKWAIGKNKMEFAKLDWNPNLAYPMAMALLESSAEEQNYMLNTCITRCKSMPFYKEFFCYLIQPSNFIKLDATLKLNLVKMNVFHKAIPYHLFVQLSKQPYLDSDMKTTILQIIRSKPIIKR